MSRYPILVERLTPATARLLVCERCGFTRSATSDEIALTDTLPPCPSCSPPWPDDPPPATDLDKWSFLEWKYVEADSCKNCGKLGFYEPPLNFCCSRACMLQAQYAESLKAERP